jgi:hypothetical protein
VATGDLMAAKGVDRLPLAAPRKMGPEQAARATLAAYLASMVFTIPSDVGTVVSFKLSEVHEEWTNEDEDKDEPSASITLIDGTREAHNLIPTVRESSLDLHGTGTVLVKSTERSFLFQVDFWVTNKPERLAIEAALDEYFSADLRRSGIMLEGPPEYWSEPVRFILDSARGTNRLDDSDSAMTRDRRLLARIRAEVDDLQLCRAVILQPLGSVAVDGGPAEPIPFPTDETSPT